MSRASAGADQHVLVARCQKFGKQLEDLVDVGYSLVVADPQAETIHYDHDFSGPVVVVLGAEGRGVSRKVMGMATGRVIIPLRGQVDSLNVSVSGGILLYEALRQRATRRRLL